MAAPDAQLKFRIGGMDCPSCATKIETAVRRVAGVGTADVALGSQTLTLSYTGPDPSQAVQKQVVDLSYEIAPFSRATHDAAADHHQLEDGPWWRSRKAMLTILCAAALGLAYTIENIFRSS